jgi:cytochrome b
MKKTSVYDLPTRFFHWLFAFLFITAFAIAKTVDDESPLFSYHMLAGLTIAFLLVLRFIWGFIGTTYARFSSFKLNPIELIQYFKDTVVTKTKAYLGHNPASSYAAVIMFTCAIGLAISGILMATGGENDSLEEIHELLANIFLISVIIHVVGIVFHHVKHRDSLWSSMLDGKKKTSLDTSGITSMRPVAGLLFVILFVSWLGYLITSYDSSTHTLNLLGTELRLGETEHESEFGYEDHDEEYDDD